jgi:hypothetical protein
MTLAAEEDSSRHHRLQDRRPARGLESISRLIAHTDRILPHFC